MVVSINLTLQIVSYKIIKLAPIISCYVFAIAQKIKVLQKYFKAQVY